PLAARAQQPAVPVVGYLNSGSPGPSTPTVAFFRQALAEAGYVEGRTVTIEYRWAEGQYDRLPAMGSWFTGRWRSSSQAPARPHSRQRVPPQRFRSCSTSRVIRSSLVLSAVLLGRKAMRPACTSSRRSWVQSNWGCCA